MRTACLALCLVAPATALAQFTVTPEPVRDRVRATADLPATQHKRNAAGSDGFGLCVYTSAWHAALWQSVGELYGFRDWMTRRPGGSYPEKFEATLAAFCQERHVPVPSYVQHTGGDDEFLSLALKTGRMACVTYCVADGPGRYGAEVVGHMVNLVHLDDTAAAILDNNFPGSWLWMSRTDFFARWRGTRPDGRPFLIRDARGRAMPVGGGWAIVLLHSPPPPYPEEPPALFAQADGRPVEVVGDWRAAAEGGPYQTGDCPDGRCPVQPSASGQWVPNVNGREWGYWVNGRCVAAAFADGRVEATDARGNATGEPIAPPAALPPGVGAKRALRVEPPASPEAFPQGGVQGERLPTETRYWHNGEPCSKEQALSALTLADDSGRWHLTVVGDAAFARTVRTDVAALPAAVRERLHVQHYRPGDWQVAQFRLGPGVTLRTPARDRVGSDVGTVPVADYSAARLKELLALDGGPAQRPRVVPAPAPSAPQPAEPAPRPAAPSGNLILLAALSTIVYLILRR
ncbi:hypothetical protein [Gemmata sp.]|uniref:hypothetical protein n=1 Tax=Gemmata sp. TaxID=1914242 RepID=UPI003F6F42E7